MKPQEYRFPLRRQATIRIAAVFMAIGGLCAVLFWLGWQLVNDRLQREQAESAAQAVEARLQALLTGWQREADALASQITFNRMLDQAGTDRWQKLRAYIVAQGEILDLSALVIVDKEDRPVFQFGNMGQECASVLMAPTVRASLPSGISAGIGKYSTVSFRLRCGWVATAAMAN